MTREDLIPRLESVSEAELQAGAVAALYQCLLDLDLGELVFLSGELRPLHISPLDRRYRVIKTQARRRRNITPRSLDRDRRNA